MPTEKKDSLFAHPRLVVSIGLVLLVLGLLGNEVFLANFFGRDGSITNVTNRILILIFEVLAVGVGLYLLITRPRVVISKGSLLLLIGSTLFTWLFLEIGLQLWLTQFASRATLVKYGSQRQIENSSGWRYVRHHYLGYVPTPNYRHGLNRHNALGFRGEEIDLKKPDSTYRIVALGGSTTYQTEIEDWKKSHTHVLQEILRERGFESVEVINAGVTAFASWESVMNLQFRVLELDPNLIIIYHGINDVHPRFCFPFTAYRADNSCARVPYTRLDGVLEASNVLRFIRARLDWRPQHARLAFLRTGEFVPTNYAEQFKRQMKDSIYPQGLFSKVSASELLTNNSPLHFERNLRSMVAIAKTHGVRPLLVTFAWSADFPQWPRVTSLEYQRAMTAHNEIVKRLCRELDVTCYDFAKEMPMDRRYFVDGRHFTEQGARKRAELYANFIERLAPQFGLERH